jgi:hypothetical protein
LMAASATFALKVGVWFRRGRLFMVSPDSLGTACPLSGRNSTYRPVQISETSSYRRQRSRAKRSSFTDVRNSILIRIQVQNIRFVLQTVRTGAVTPGPLSVPTLLPHRWVDLLYEA